MKYKYTVLTYNFDGYELLHEIVNPDPEVEYLYITNDKNLKSNTWKIILEESLNDLSSFDKTFYVRYNLFKYASTDIVVRIDGSIQVLGSLDKLVNEFINGNYDACIQVHPYTNNLYDEYVKWITYRNYSKDDAERILNNIANLNYDVKKYKGLYQLCFSINKKGKITENIDRMTYSYLKYLGKNDNIERLDQTVFSFILNKFFNNIKILPVSQHILDSDMLCMYAHNSNKMYTWNFNNMPYGEEGYLFNEKIKLFY